MMNLLPNFQAPFYLQRARVIDKVNNLCWFEIQPSIPKYDHENDKKQKVWDRGLVQTAPEKFENSVLFLRLGLSSTLTELYEDAL